MDSTEVRETSMVIGDSHARRRSSNLKPHLTESDVRLNIAQQASNPRQNSLSTVSEGSECAGFRFYDHFRVIFAGWRRLRHFEVCDLPKGLWGIKSPKPKEQWMLAQTPSWWESAVPPG